MENDWVLLARVANAPLAYMAQAALAHEGLNVEILDEHTAGMFGNTGLGLVEVRLMVPERQLLLAREAWARLQAVGGEQIPLPDAGDEVPKPPTISAREAIESFEQDYIPNEARKAFRAAVLGLIFLPGIFSYLSWQHMRRAFQYPPAQRPGSVGFWTFVGTLNIAGFGLALMLLWSLSRALWAAI